MLISVPIHPCAFVSDVIFQVASSLYKNIIVFVFSISGIILTHCKRCFTSMSDRGTSVRLTHR